VTVAFVVLAVVFVASMVAYGRRVEREARAARPAPLESSTAREAVRAAIERRER
jgi:hypothetical protein